MDTSTIIPNALAISLCLATFLIGLRAFFLYRQAKSIHMLILGQAMSIISLTALADFASSNITAVSLQTDWFLYVGQLTGFLFILLNLLDDSEVYLQRLKHWQIAVSGLALILLIASPVLPTVPSTILRALLSGSRAFLCGGIFYAYASKQTRFSLLVGVAYFLLAIGYTIIFQEYFAPDEIVFDNMGDMIRMGAVLLLPIALWIEEMHTRYPSAYAGDMHE